ncbi:MULTISPECIES: aminotransferase class I/II-fold pyridoxal phosphate-dependent enzyme [unclassified Streptomyces]|uniref:aminotransferase class I/II-fold pyridoxal phosphate-dependent enzyme n=1 Tax=unclassified Streptomyces TaxID=2593676 RepID=UPI0027E24BD2|nr:MULTISPECIES: aminotransferase class I/II-fold pyridoxal phosphate-dependent enzyme [unclassified Streptomyces]
MERAGRPAKLFYTVPIFQNPAGVTLAAERRLTVLEVCRRAGVLVLDDNPYGLLHLEGEPMRALRADAPADVVYLGSFSKTPAPGLRVGWALAPSAVRDKLVLAAESAMLSHSAFNWPWTGTCALGRGRSSSGSSGRCTGSGADAMLDAAPEGGGADDAVAEFVPDKADGRFSDQSRLTAVIEADLLGNLVGADEVLALEGDCGQAATLQAGGVHQLVGEDAQVLVVRGRLDNAAGLLPPAAAGEGRRTSRLVAAAQQ